MKTLKYIILSATIFGMVATTGCKKDDDALPSETDIQLNTLMNNGTNWTLAPGGVIKDGLDVTSQFAGFKLKFGDKTYNTDNGQSPVWQPSGTWDFQNDNPGLILRDDGVLITVTVTSNSLILNFNAEGVNASGRTMSVAGEYQFHLVSE